MAFTSEDLTGPRMSRAVLALQALPARTDPLPVEEAQRMMRRRCGVPQDETLPLVELLMAAAVVSVVDGGIGRLPLGTKVAKAAKSGDSTLFGVALLRAGFFYEQGRQLWELGTRTPDGHLTCSARKARRAAAQLVGILSWWAGVETAPSLVIPSALVDELEEIWAFVLPPDSFPQHLKDRKEVGARGELYTLRFERGRSANPRRVIWTAVDVGDHRGWDVEDLAASPIRRIEVKGGRGKEVKFFLSNNEWEKAKRHGSGYEIQYWGEIDLAQSRVEEYARLREAGYPLVCRNPAEELTKEEEWSMKPDGWRVARI